MQTILLPLIQYFLFCLFSLLTGRGVLKLLFSEDQVDRHQFLFPIVSLTFWALFLGIGVALYIPLRYLVYVLWTVSLLFVVFGVRKFWPSQIFAWAGITTLTLILSLPYVLHGFHNFMGSPAPDGWAYAAYGQYLWKYIRCTEGGLPPLYQYGAYLCHARYIASSLLQFISVFVGSPGISQAGMGYLLPWAFWIYTASLMFFIQHHGFHEILKWVYLIFGVLSGWLFTVLFANNFDNALAISFLPAIAGIIQIGDWKERKWSLLIALFVSAATYIYPELAPFLVFGTVIFLWDSISRAHLSLNELIRKLVFIWLAILLLMAPYISELLAFLQRQSAQIYAQVRPGGNLSIEIVSPRLMGISFWGVTAGDAYLNSNTFDFRLYYWIAIILATLLTLFFVCGLLSQFSKKEWGYISIQVVFSVFIAYFIFEQKYGYGAYKIILLDWWLIAFFLITGIDKIISISNQNFQRAGRIVIAIAVLIFVLFFGLRIRTFEKAVQFKNTLHMSDLQSALQIVNGHPLAITVLSMTPNLWAVYYVRDNLVFFYPYRSYPITLASEYTDRATLAAPESTSFLLTDFDDSLLLSQADLVWQNPIYYLWKWKSDRWAYIAEINNPNGLEIFNGEKFFWLGGKPASIEWIVSRTGLVELSLDTILGPSLPDSQERHLRIILPDGSNIFRTVSQGTFTLELPVIPGKNTLVMEVLDPPALQILSNGDTRPLLLGIKNILVLGIR